MWLPFTNRAREGELEPVMASTSPTQGPAVLISTRAWVTCVSPPARVVISQRSACRCREVTGVRGRMSAPRSAASLAVSTTRRLSSTQQSEYSKPIV